jgi:small neutral amino acid transporter SnatA (MarC family)
MRYCRVIVNAIGPAALLVISKILGVILAALAVQFMLKGVSGLGIIATSR